MNFGLCDVFPTKEHQNFLKEGIIYFTKDVYDTDEHYLQEQDVKINDGTHTAHIQMQLGIFQSDDYYVDFEKHLGGRISEAINLGNLLNRAIFEKVHKKDCKINRFRYSTT